MNCNLEGGDADNHCYDDGCPGDEKLNVSHEEA